MQRPKWTSSKNVSGHLDFYPLFLFFGILRLLRLNFFQKLRFKKWKRRRKKSTQEIKDLILGFHQSCDQTNNLKRSTNKFKNSKNQVSPVFHVSRKFKELFMETP